MIRRFGKGYTVALEPSVVAKEASNPRPLTRAAVAEWPDEYLAFATAPGNQTPYNREVVMRELRRREAWDAPAARAFQISIFALIVAIAAAAASGYAAFFKPAPAAPIIVPVAIEKSVCPPLSKPVPPTSAIARNVIKPTGP